MHTYIFLNHFLIGLFFGLYRLCFFPLRLSPRGFAVRSNFFQKTQESSAVNTEPVCVFRVFLCVPISVCLICQSQQREYTLMKLYVSSEDLFLHDAAGVKSISVFDSWLSPFDSRYLSGLLIICSITSFYLSVNSPNSSLYYLRDLAERSSRFSLIPMTLHSAPH